MSQRMYLVKDYFPDLLNRLSYYPGETFSTEQLRQRGMSERDIEHYKFRAHLEELDTAPPAETVNAEVGLMMDAASNEPHDQPLPQADQRGPNPEPRPALATTEQPAQVLAEQEIPPAGLVAGGEVQAGDIRAADPGFAEVPADKLAANAPGDEHGGSPAADHEGAPAEAPAPGAEAPAESKPAEDPSSPDELGA